MAQDHFKTPPDPKKGHGMTKNQQKSKISSRVGQEVICLHIFFRVKANSVLEAHHHMQALVAFLTNRVNRAHGPTKENKQIPTFFACFRSMEKLA